MTRLPLYRFKVLDLTAHRAGPTAVRQFGSWRTGALTLSRLNGQARTPVMQPGAPAMDLTIKTFIAISAA